MRIVRPSKSESKISKKIHFSFPTSNITDSQHSLSDMKNALADKFSYWIPSADLETFRQDGYYSTQVRPGLRIISLNTMFQYTLNL